MEDLNKAENFEHGREEGSAERLQLVDREHPSFSYIISGKTKEYSVGVDLVINKEGSLVSMQGILVLKPDAIKNAAVIPEKRPAYYYAP